MIIKCANCGEEKNIKPYAKKEYNYCSRNCMYEHSIVRTIKKIEIANNIEDLYLWLYRKYVTEKMSLHMIEKLLGITNRTPPKLLKYYHIEQRSISESVKLDWEENESKKQLVSANTKIFLNTQENREKLKEIMQTEQYKKKMSIANSGDKNGMRRIPREQHYNYNPNLTLEDRIPRRLIPEYKGWSFKVFEKDNFTCQCCGDNKGGNLNAHHLDGYNWCKEKRTDVNNGICLCNKCHKEFHKIYGKKDNTKEQFHAYKNNKEYEITKYNH